MKNKFLILWVVLIMVLSSCGTQAQGGGATPTPYPTPIKQTYTVQRGDISVDAKIGGRVSALALYTVYFQIGGQVHEVYANVNDIVTKDQLLGELEEAKDLRVQAGETQRIIRRAQIKLEIAQLNLEAYKAQNKPAYQIRIQELEVESAQMDLDEVLDSLGIDPNIPIVNEIDAQVAKARAFAPADGTIIAAVNIGRNVTTTTPAFVIGDPTKLEVIAELDAGTADEINQMYEGMPLTATIDAKPDLKFTGTIRQLPSPYGTGPSEESLIHILLDTPPSEDTYQIGDKLRTNIQLASKQNILWLPPEAVRSVSGRTFVIINSDNGPKRVDVEVGLKTQEMIEIVSGLTEGQVVIGP